MDKTREIDLGPIKEIDLGSIKLTQDAEGEWAHHPALKTPVRIDPEQLRRWIMRQLRELLA